MPIAQMPNSDPAGVAIERIPKGVPKPQLANLDRLKNILQQVPQLHKELAENVEQFKVYVVRFNSLIVRIDKVVEEWEKKE